MTREYNTFMGLLLAASHTSETVDYFDLRSEIPASAAAFLFLLGEQHEAVTALVQHVRDHADAILAGLGPPPDGVPAETPPGLGRASEIAEWRHKCLSMYAITAERLALGEKP